MELLIMVDAARRASADRITAVIPFFDMPARIAKTSRACDHGQARGQLLNAAGVESRAYHGSARATGAGLLRHPGGPSLFTAGLDQISATAITGKTTVVSPDLGGLKMARHTRKRCVANLAIVAKERRSATETEALYLIGEVEGRDVLLVDDLTETAGTLTSAAKLMKKRGAQKIYAGVSHAVLVDMAIPRFAKNRKSRN